MNDWIKPGAEVTIVGGDAHRRTAVDTTIERVLKRDVVCANGERFSLRRATNGLIYRPKGTWDPSDVLCPRDSDLARDAHRAKKERRCRDGALTCISNASAALNHRRYDEARDELRQALAILDGGVDQ